MTKPPKVADEHFAKILRRQSAINAKVFRVFAAEGDNLKESREVCHWAYFPTEKLQQSFQAAVQQLGYRTLATEPHSYSEELPYGVEFIRVESVRPTIINNVCAELVILAKEHGGEYDGWEAQVV